MPALAGDPAAPPDTPPPPPLPLAAVVPAACGAPAAELPAGVSAGAAAPAVPGCPEAAVFGPMPLASSPAHANRSSATATHVKVGCRIPKIWPEPSFFLRVARNTRTERTTCAANRRDANAKLDAPQSDVGSARLARALRMCGRQGKHQPCESRRGRDDARSERGRTGCRWERRWAAHLVPVRLHGECEPSHAARAARERCSAQERVSHAPPPRGSDRALVRPRPRSWVSVRRGAGVARRRARAPRS